MPGSGAAVNTAVVSAAGLGGVAVIANGLAPGRWLGILASTMGSIMTLRERAFIAVVDMAKATVQAAIGGGLTSSSWGSRTGGQGWSGS